MTDPEYTEFVRLLHLYAEEMDQWEMRKFDGRDGTIYFSLTLFPFPGTQDGQYEELIRHKEDVIFPRSAKRALWKDAKKCSCKGEHYFYQRQITLNGEKFIYYTYSHKPLPY